MIDPIEENYYISRSDKLIHYSQYSFLKEIDKSTQLSNLIVIPFNKIWEKGLSLVVNIQNKKHYFLIEKLEWDSNYFNGNMYRLHSVLYDHQILSILTEAVQEFKNIFFLQEKRHCYAKIPSEDTLLIKALCANSFCLTETRLNFYKELQDYNHPRFIVKKCDRKDAELMREVASKNRNIYDRFHADSYFTDEMADNFLGEYAFQSVMGYADTVLIPAEEGVPPNAFIAVDIQKKDLPVIKEITARITLTAVDPLCKGWHLKLCSEASYFAKEQNARWMLMTTQSTNAAVFKTCQKLNFCLGSTEHIFSFNN